MTYWDTFKGEPVFLHEEGGKFYISASEDPDETKHWLDKLVDLHDDRPDFEFDFGSQKVKIEEMGPMLKDIVSFVDSIELKNPPSGI